MKIQNIFAGGVVAAAFFAAPQIAEAQTGCVAALSVLVCPTPAPTASPTIKPTPTPTAIPTPKPTPVPTATPMAIAGVVSDSLTATGFNICSSPPLFAGFGCNPVVYAVGVKITGTPAVGAAFTATGSAAPPIFTAATINFAVPPTPAPTATPSGTFLGLPNAQDWPAVFNPWAATSVWNTRVSANPRFASYSASVVSNQFPSGLEMLMRANEAGQYDYSHVRFFATSTDPLVKIACNQFCNPPDNGGVPATMHIPAIARIAGGTDAEIFVVQPDGTEIDFWAAYGSPGSDPTWTAPHDMQTRDWQTGDTITAGNVTNCGNLATGTGWVVAGPGPTAAGYCQSGGLVLASELISGHINHALQIVGECAIGNQYPSQNNASTQQCTSGVGPPLGGREWYDVPCATTQATGLKPWEKAILCALNQYGAYFGDNGSGGAFFTAGIAPELESEEPWRDYNGTGTDKAFYTSPYAPLAAQGWSAINVPNAIGAAGGLRWFGADPWNIWTELGESESQFASHIHWLDPCSAQGTC